MLKRIDIYPNKESDHVAEKFFRYYYHDRGMLKWQGYFLSDHTAALKRHKAFLKRRAGTNYLPQQSPSTINQKIVHAWQHHQPVQIVLNIVSCNQQYQTVTGQVTGYYESQIVVLDSTKKSHLITLSDIRNIS